MRLMTDKSHMIFDNKEKGSKKGVLMLLNILMSLAAPFGDLFDACGPHISNEKSKRYVFWKEGLVAWKSKLMIFNLIAPQDCLKACPVSYFLPFKTFINDKHSPSRLHL